MHLAHLSPTDTALSVAPESLGLADTSELLLQPLPWIGQARPANTPAPPRGVKPKTPCKLSAFLPPGESLQARPAARA